jgi:hypothetical protein
MHYFMFIANLDAHYSNRHTWTKSTLNSRHTNGRISTLCGFPISLRISLDTALVGINSPFRFFFRHWISMSFLFISMSLHVSFTIHIFICFFPEQTKSPCEIFFCFLPVTGTTVLLSCCPMCNCFRVIFMTHSVSGAATIWIFQRPIWVPIVPAIPWTKATQIPPFFT